MKELRKTITTREGAYSDVMNKLKGENLRRNMSENRNSDFHHLPCDLDVQPLNRDISHELEIDGLELFSSMVLDAGSIPSLISSHLTLQGASWDPSASDSLRWDYGLQQFSPLVPEAENILLAQNDDQSLYNSTNLPLCDSSPYPQMRDLCTTNNSHSDNLQLTSVRVKPPPRYPSLDNENRRTPPPPYPRHLLRRTTLLNLGDSWGNSWSRMGCSSPVSPADVGSSPRSSGYFSTPSPEQTADWWSACDGFPGEHAGIASEGRLPIDIACAAAEIDASSHANAPHPSQWTLSTNDDVQKVFESHPQQIPNDYEGLPFINIDATSDANQSSGANEVSRSSPRQLFGEPKPHPRQLPGETIKDTIIRCFVKPLFEENQHETKSTSSSGGQVMLWQYLLELLSDNKYTSIINWEGVDGEFKVANKEEVARRWGERKGKDRMNYENMSRALRYYYDKGLLEKVHGQKYRYKFKLRGLFKSSLPSGISDSQLAQPDFPMTPSSCNNLRNFSFPNV